MNIVIAPDSFKGSLTAYEVAFTIKKALTTEIENANVELIPMADGGEGTLETLLYATNGRLVEIEATGPLGERIQTAYGILGDGETAVIEMAKVAGLPMIPKGKRNPMLTTTYGVGELMLAAVQQGYRKIYIGLGGSGTNDGGLGMLQALGATFLNKDGNPVRPIGASLKEIATVNFSTIEPLIHQCSVKVISDVTNPLCGLQGASYIFGPQKGATKEQIEELDEGLLHFASLVEKTLNRKFQEVPGAGAAGGLGFGLLSIGAEVVSGSEAVAEATGLKEKIKEADLVITGEGQSDFQTLFGKAPFYVAKIAKEFNVKTILISGSLGEKYEQLYDFFISCHSISPGPVSLENSIQNAEAYLYQASRNIARLIKSFQA